MLFNSVFCNEQFLLSLHDETFYYWVLGNLLFDWRIWLQKHVIRVKSLEVCRYWCKILTSMFAFLPSRVIYYMMMLNDVVFIMYIWPNIRWNYHVITYLLMDIVSVDGSNMNIICVVKYCRIEHLSRGKRKFVGSDFQTTLLTVTINWV